MLREEVKVENGRSALLGSSLSVCEGAELMEGAAAAAAAAGRTTENKEKIYEMPWNWTKP